MPWYWILIIFSAIFGPFEAMQALNRAWKKREERRKAEEHGKREEERKEN